MDKQQTSVFSEYEPMDNCSVNSRQLEHWLKQISSPGQSAKFGFEWTFMSNASSRYEPEDLSFAKNHTFQSCEKQKQNASTLSNKGARQHKETKNKSYVNAMLALQKKVQTLQDENTFVKRNLSRLSEERNRSISDSQATEEELRSRLLILEPKTKRVDELIEENKRLRETKDEKTRKTKIVQKKLLQMKEKYQQLAQNFEEVKKERDLNEKKIQETKTTLDKFQEEIKKVSERNRMLEEMKEKSTLTLLQKYNKSVQMTEQFERENGKLKKQIAHLKKTQQEEVKKIQDSHQNQISKYRVELEKLKESYEVRESMAEETRKQVQYFRQAYEKKDQQFTELAKNQQKLQKLIQDSQVVNVPHTLTFVPGEKKSFEGLQSENEIQFEESEIPLPIPTQTKSVTKPLVKKHRKSSLSSSEKGEKVEKGHKKAIPKENKSFSMRESKPSKMSSKQIKRDKKKNQSIEEESYLIKSGDGPRTQPQHRITFEGDGLYSDSADRKVVNSYYYSSHYPPHPLSSGHQNHEQFEIQEFHKKNTSFHSFDEALLMQLQRELLDLYEQQQKLILASNDQFTSQSERGEYIGRLKQLNEQLRVKNQKICELKSKL